MKTKVFRTMFFFGILIYFVSGFLIYITGYDISYESFVVDENEIVYLCKSNEIDVYNGDSYLYSIDVSEYRGFNFIAYNNNVLIQRGGNYYSVNEKGVETPITSEEFNSVMEANKIALNSQTRYTTQETSYKMKNKYLKTKIVDESDNRVIYELDNKHLYIKLGYYGCTAIATALILYAVAKADKKDLFNRTR